jgi:ABC-2 type transport system ATP-binding protein
MPARYEVERLTKVYRGWTIPANEDISFTLEAGEILGLLGENGAGKTTLVKQMMNLIAPTRGTVRLDGVDIAREPDLVPLRVGYLPQRPYAIQDLTVSQAIYLTGHIRGLSRADARREANELVEQWRLERLRDRPIRRLSGGERRLVGMATAIVGGRGILILDEPTNELDPVNRHHVWESLLRLNRERGTTILLVTHNLLEAERVVQRVAIMRSGQMIAVGRPSELKRRLGRTVQIELTLAPGEDTVARLRALFGDEAREVAPDRWVIVVPRDDLGEVMPRLLDRLGSETIEDVRLQTHSLEDLYLAFDREGRAIEREQLEQRRS